MSMQDRRVVVLGGTSGIGLEVARAVLRQGGRPVVVSSRRDSVEAALASLRSGAEGWGAEGKIADARDEAALAALFEEIGDFDHLAFTAGESLMIGPLAGLDLAQARGFLDLRYWGAVAAAKHGAPHIRPGGSITFSSGIAGQRPPGAGWAISASICAAMEGLTRALALDLKPIRVNIVSPGFVRTPLWRNIPEAEREAMYAQAGDRLPVGRVGTPAEIADAYLFLMQQGFATGQTLVVDGGGLLA